jgi:hypothetical protein
MEMKGATLSSHIDDALQSGLRMCCGGTVVYFLFVCAFVCFPCGTAARGKGLRILFSCTDVAKRGFAYCSRAVWRRADPLVGSLVFFSFPCAGARGGSCKATPYPNGEHNAQVWLL